MGALSAHNPCGSPQTCPFNPIHLLHQPIRFQQGHDDALIVGDVLKREGAAHAVFQPFLGWKAPCACRTFFDGWSVIEVEQIRLLELDVVLSQHVKILFFEWTLGMVVLLIHDVADDLVTLRT